METVTLTETGCYLDSHRGHYITEAVIDMAVAHGWILDPMLKWVVDQYEAHNADEDYPHEGLIELADAAIEWLNSGQDKCPHCSGHGGIPNPGVEWWTDKDGDIRCKPCSGAGRAPRIDGQNFPPIIPEGTAWAFNDGDFGIYSIEDELSD